MEPMDDDAVEAAARELGWEYREGSLVKVVQREDFAAALAYVNRVAAVAEAANHHPDVDIRWNTVTLRLRTHSAGAVTTADVDLARRIDAIG